MHLRRRCKIFRQVEVLKLLRHGNVYIFCLIHKGKLIPTYFFRNDSQFIPQWRRFMTFAMCDVFAINRQPRSKLRGIQNSASW